MNLAVPVPLVTAANRVHPARSAAFDLDPKHDRFLLHSWMGLAGWGDVMAVSFLKFVRRDIFPRRGVGLLLVGCAGLGGGCGHSDFPGIEEYKEITAHARMAVEAALRSLDQVSGAPTPCPPKLAAEFSRNVQRLEVDSIHVRARAQAILARGDSYFAEWSESMAKINKPRVRELADRFHPELEQSFNIIKSSSKQAGDFFRPFLASLRSLRVKLEGNPNGLAADSAKDSIRETRENGQRVVRELDAIKTELQAVTTVLTPGRSAKS